MKTKEVLDTILKEKTMSRQHTRSHEDALMSLSRYSEDWPTSPGVINAWTNSLSRDGKYTDTTIKLWFVVAKSAAKYMEDIYELKPNPFTKAKTPKVNPKLRRYYKPNEMYQILASCRDGYDRELVITLIDSTCRIGELSGLKGKDIDAEDGWINVKGKTGYKRYKLDIRICQALKQLAGSDEGYVFRDTRGGMASANNLAQRVRRICIRAGITGEKIGAHSIRHSDASLVARFTKSPLAVKALLRHKKIATSMEYIHDVEDDLQREYRPLEILEQIIAKENGGKVDVHKMLEPRQVTMGEGQGMTTDIVLAEPEIVEGQIDLANDLFPEVTEGVKVRPLLKTDDLKVLRRVFIEFYRQGGNHDDMIKARELMKRMLRKT